MTKPAISLSVETTRDRVFDADGTIKGLKFTAASGRRPAVLGVSIARGTPNPLTTGFSVEGKDFRSVYANVVHLIAAYYEVLQDQELVAAMLATCDLFLAKSNLRLEPVVIRYEQVVAAAADQSLN